MHARPAAAAATVALLVPLAACAPQPDPVDGTDTVAFAVATVGDAPVLVAEDPSKDLDPGARADLAALLRGHVAVGGALLTFTGRPGPGPRTGG